MPWHGSQPYHLVLLYDMDILRLMQADGIGISYWKFARGWDDRFIAGLRVCWVTNHSRETHLPVQGACILAGTLGTVTMPFLERHIGVRSTGTWGIRLVYLEWCECMLTIPAFQLWSCCHLWWHSFFCKLQLENMVPFGAHCWCLAVCMLMVSHSYWWIIGIILQKAGHMIFDLATVSLMNIEILHVLNHSRWNSCKSHWKTILSKMPSQPFSSPCSHSSACCATWWPWSCQNLSSSSGQHWSPGCVWLELVASMWPTWGRQGECIYDLPPFQMQ